MAEFVGVSCLLFDKYQYEKGTWLSLHTKAHPRMGCSRAEIAEAMKPIFRTSFRPSGSFIVALSDIEPQLYQVSR